MAQTDYIKKKRRQDTLFKWLMMMCVAFGILMLLLLLTQIVMSGISKLNWDFIRNFPSRMASKAGVKSALAGSIWLLITTVAIALPIGIGTAVYLEEFSKKNRWRELVQINISNLAGVPSIVYGMLGLAVFVRMFGFGRSVLSGGLTLALLILPVIIVTSQEALRGVPKSLYQGSLALGLTKLQTLRGVILPYAIPSILTGAILAISRALGEAAPLIMVGAVGYVAFTPESIMDQYTALPIQIFNWTSRPQKEFQEVAAAGIMVLMAILLSFNGFAILLRNKFQKRAE